MRILQSRRIPARSGIKLCTTKSRRITTVSVPTVPELAEEGEAADMAANAIGGNITTIITQVREANEAFQRTLANERETFL